MNINPMQRGITWLPVIFIIAAVILGGVVGWAIWNIPELVDTEEAPAVVIVNGNSNGNTNESTNANASVNENVNISEQTATTSYGVWFPYNDDQTINNPRPVIYGKVSQQDEVYLETEFGQKDWAGRDFGDAKTLTFKPGAVQNLTIKLDGQKVSGVVGFAQYPSVVCWKQNGAILYNTENECREALNDEMPPLIFVFQPTSDLSVGQHTLSVDGTTMEFSYSPTYTIETQTVPRVSEENRIFDVLDTADNCSPGYYQSSNDMPIALPVLEDTNLFYGLSFPQTEDEKGSIQRRHVEIVLAGKQFPLFFPDSTTYFEGKTVGNTAGRTDFGLFVPLDQLVYSDGKAASPWALYEADPGYEDLVTGYYSEIYPVDISGHEYRGQSIPWVMSTSSGCDG